jgi:hypothetical protein
MNHQINRFTAYTNCPSGEYWAAFCNSEVKKYPKGKREVLTFLILNDDKETPKINNKEEPYYSTIICNESKGSNPKSKVSKIKKAILTKEEYDPIDIHLGLPTIETFYKRILKVKVCPKSNNKNFITHIQRPRDDQWECIEGEFEGIYFKNPYKLYLKQRHKIRQINKGACAEDIKYYLLDIKMPYVDNDGNFTGVIDNDKYNNLDKYRKQRADDFYKRLMNFIQSENLDDLFPYII